MAGTTPDLSGAGERWRSRRVASWLLRALIFVAPLVAAILASLWLSTRLFEPTSAPMVVGWWAILIGASSLVAWAVDRFGRRFLPLTVLLRATMLFPDRAPSRYKVALRTSNVSELRRRIAEAEEKGETDLSLAAELVLSLATALNKHDRKTRGHGERTRAYTDILAEELKVPEEGRDKLRWAALLHDIGKLDVSADILNKEGPLDEAELAIMRRHPLMGMRVAAPIVPWLGEWAGAIEHHHERWDGLGYPRGLAGTEISFAARIVSVADAYDVMTSGRSYQKAVNADDARRELAREAGGQFDPTVVRALMNVSLGRLRWVLGPMASLGPIPFFLDRIGRDFLTLSTAATVTASAVVSGAVPIPTPRLMPPPAITVQAEVNRLPTSEVFDQAVNPTDEAGGGVHTTTSTPDTTTPDTASTTASTTTSTTIPTPETTAPTTDAASYREPPSYLASDDRPTHHRSSDHAAAAHRQPRRGFHAGGRNRHDLRSRQRHTHRTAPRRADQLSQVRDRHRQREPGRVHAPGQRQRNRHLRLPGL